MTPYFGGNNRHNCGGATLTNGYWQIYDMIDLVRINDSWNAFAYDWNNVIFTSWDSWLESHINKWGPNSQLFIDFWKMDEMLDTLYDAFTNNYEGNNKLLQYNEFFF
jgi:hypothetical protein